MSKAARGIVAGVVLMAVLTACGGSDDGLDAFRGDGDKPPVTLTPDMVRTALPSKASAPKGFEGDDIEVEVGDEAVEACTGSTESNCGGLLSMGGTDFDTDDSGRSDSSDYDGEVVFGILAFQSPDDARATYKALVTDERSKAEKDGKKAKPVEIDAGAEETVAFEDADGETMVMMRIGSVVAVVNGDGTFVEKPNYNDFAKLQIDRLKKTAEGMNPDA
ncbi:hypothetical protein [Streptomyces sp. NBC_01353]|uniref:hypothetical protein n=1 Tax=Streptomyces sp. NBC_01353 TaxID=2903835 RepID=UPI002E37C232|nr:hypothetical protein [Streptomyces sp. NBC_01353]